MHIVLDYDTRKKVGAAFNYFAAAKDAANALKDKTGKNYLVAETKVVWSTKTLDELDEVR